MSITITGTVTRTEFRRTGLDDAVAVITLDAGQRLPFEVRFLFKADDRKPRHDPIQDAERHAYQYVKGTTLTVQALTLRHRTDHGSEAFVVEAAHP